LKSSYCCAPDVLGDASREWAKPTCAHNCPSSHIHHVKWTSTAEKRSHKRSLRRCSRLAVWDILFRTHHLPGEEGRPCFIDPPSPPEPSLFAETTLNHPACPAFLEDRSPCLICVVAVVVVVVVVEGPYSKSHHGQGARPAQFRRTPRAQLLPETG
jgi:hypothetical protein